EKLIRANDELIQRNSKTLSRTSAMKVDCQQLNMEISKWATDSNLHITIGDVEALHEAILSALEPASPDNKTAVGDEPFTLFPDDSYERVQGRPQSCNGDS